RSRRVWSGLTTRQSRRVGSYRSETKGDVGANRPAHDIRPPDIGSTDSDPLSLPELLEHVHDEAPVDLVHVIHSQALPQIGVQLGPAQIPAGAQLMAGELDCQRNIQIDFVGERARVAADVNVAVGAAKVLGISRRSTIRAPADKRASCWAGSRSSPGLIADLDRPHYFESSSDSASRVAG